MPECPGLTPNVCSRPILVFVSSNFLSSFRLFPYLHSTFIVPFIIKMNVIIKIFYPPTLIRRMCASCSWRFQTPCDCWLILGIKCFPIFFWMIILRSSTIISGTIQTLINSQHSALIWQSGNNSCWNKLIHFLKSRNLKEPWTVVTHHFQIFFAFNWNTLFSSVIVRSEWLCCSQCPLDVTVAVV